MTTAVVILNWNTREYLERWLPALVGSCARFDACNPGDSACVVVADNASSDGSLQFVRENYPGIRTVGMDINSGFTGGYNKALALLDDDLFVLLNSDVEVSEDWLTPLVRWMKGNPECAVCGPKIHRMTPEPEFEYAGAAGGYIDRYGYPFCRGRVLGRTEKDHGQYDKPADVLWISGACMMVRSCVWKELGGLDDRFFAHMEEIDFCWRAQLAGHKVNVVPESVVRHLGGGTLPKTSPFKLKLNYRNNLLLLDNNLAPTIGRRKAARRISFRKMLDTAAAAVYLLSGRKDCFHAVLEAHREFKTLSAGSRGEAGTCTGIAGYRNICIILQSALHGKRIFDHLAKYENCH